MDSELIRAEIEALKEFRRESQGDRRDIHSKIAELIANDSAASVEIKHLTSSVEKLDQAVVDLGQSLKGLTEALNKTSNTNLRWALLISSTLIVVAVTIALAVK